MIPQAPGLRREFFFMVKSILDCAVPAPSGIVLGDDVSRSRRIANLSIQLLAKPLPSAVY